MTRLEKWGAEYAMLLRRRAAQQQELERTDEELEKLYQRLVTAPQSLLYQDTGEQSQVGDERPTERLLLPAALPERFNQISSFTS